MPLLRSIVGRIPVRPVMAGNMARKRAKRPTVPVKVKAAARTRRTPPAVHEPVARMRNPITGQDTTRR